MPVLEKIDKRNPGRTFEVLKGQVGAWRQGTAFSEYEFRRIHPAPKTTDDGETVDAEEYYEAALVRLLDDLKVIRHVADRKPDETPVGPESNPPKPYANPMVAEVVKVIQESSNNAGNPIVPKK